MNKKVNVFILGARMHYAVPRILEANGYLNKMYTDFYIGNKPILKFFINLFFKNKLIVKKANGRLCNDIPNNKIKSFDIFGIKALKKRSKATNGRLLSETQAKVNQNFNEILKEENISNIDIVYSFNAASSEIFESLNKKVFKILEQTIAPKKIEENLLKREFEIWGDIDKTLYFDLNHPIILREENEWESADLILAPSKFVYNGLIECGVTKEKIKIVPYGVDSKSFKFKKRIRKNNDKHLNVFFGGHIGIRKGVHYLLKSIEYLDMDNYTFKLAGNITFEKKFLEKSDNKVEFLGRVPRSEMRELMEWSDIFLFPSLCEGSATVIYEALLSGVPVICTENSGSLIKDGEDGFIIEACNSKDISEKLEIIRMDFKLYNKMNSYINKNKDRYSLQNYEKNLINVIENLEIK